MNWKNPVRVTAYIGWEIFNGAAYWWVNGSGTASGPVRFSWQFPPPRFSFSGGFGSPFGALYGVLFRPFPLLGEHGWLNPPGPAKRCRQTNQYCNTISQPLTS